MNDSPDNPEKTQPEPGGRVEHWNRMSERGWTWTWRLGSEVVFVVTS